MEKNRRSISKHDDKASRVLNARIADPPPVGHGIKGDMNSSFDLPDLTMKIPGNYCPSGFTHLAVPPPVIELNRDEFY